MTWVHKDVCLITHFFWPSWPNLNRFSEIRFKLVLPKALVFVLNGVPIYMYVMLRILASHNRLLWIHDVELSKFLLRASKQTPLHGLAINYIISSTEISITTETHIKGIICVFIMLFLIKHSGILPNARTVPSSIWLCLAGHIRSCRQFLCLKHALLHLQPVV